MKVVVVVAAAAVVAVVVMEVLVVVASGVDLSQNRWWGSGSVRSRHQTASGASKN